MSDNKLGHKHTQAGWQGTLQWVGVNLNIAPNRKSQAWQREKGICSEANKQKRHFSVPERTDQMKNKHNQRGGYKIKVDFTHEFGLGFYFKQTNKMSKNRCFKFTYFETRTNEIEEEEEFERVNETKLRRL